MKLELIVEPCIHMYIQRSNSTRIDTYTCVSIHLNRTLMGYICTDIYIKENMERGQEKLLQAAVNFFPCKQIKKASLIAGAAQNKQKNANRFEIIASTHK